MTRPNGSAANTVADCPTPSRMHGVRHDRELVAKPFSERGRSRVMDYLTKRSWSKIPSASSWPGEPTIQASR